MTCSFCCRGADALPAASGVNQASGAGCWVGPREKLSSGEEAGSCVLMVPKEGGQRSLAWSGVAAVAKFGSFPTLFYVVHAGVAHAEEALSCSLIPPSTH